MTGQPEPQPAQRPAPPDASTPASLATGIRPAVPLSVWPAIPPPDPCPAAPIPVPCPRRPAAAAAAMLVTAFTRPGDLVAAPDPGIASLVTGAATAAGRRTVSLAHVAGQHDPAAFLHDGCHQAGQCALAITATCPVPGCPQPGTADGEDAGLGIEYAACHRLLRPGGVLAVITTAARTPSWPAEVIAYARAAGFTYAQHVIALHAPIRDSRLHPPAGSLTLAGQPGRWHLPAHSDYLIFTSPGGHRDD